MDSDRLYAVTHKLADYVKSPSLRHIRDPHSLQKLAKEIVKDLDRASSVWGKWDGPREEFAKQAAPCWIPIEDLPDVAQRLRAFWEEPYSTYPDEDFRAGGVAIYETEKAQGTELTAIVGAICEHLEKAEEQRQIHAGRGPSALLGEGAYPAGAEVDVGCRLRMAADQQVPGFLFSAQWSYIPHRVRKGQTLEALPYRNPG